MLAESVFRYLVAMTQLRAMGSMLGMLVYLVFWLLHPNRQRLVSPFASAKGEGRRRSDDRAERGGRAE